MLAIGVRSAVSRPAAGTPASPESREGSGHGRIYAVLAVLEVKSEARLVKPVDEARLIYRLQAELNAAGFQPAHDRQPPEILVTVEYGRGWLKNPYLQGGDLPVFNSAPELDATSDVATQNVYGSTNHYMDLLSPGREAEQQKASYEKLYVRITAFKYSSDPKARAHILWKTTMVVDDPDHRDLNTLVPYMLAAGAHYFDRAMTEKEITFSVTAPIARVGVGIPEVLGQATAATGPARAAPVVAPPPVTVLRRQFDLPAGEAAATLQTFSRQSGEEILYPAEQVRAVRTQAVTGEFSARAALDRMLDQTGLVAEWNGKSGIIIIRRASR